MVTRKRKTDDTAPCCANCAHGEFEPKDDAGECRFFPMTWVVIGDELQGRWAPAMRKGLCFMYTRRTH